MKTYLVYGTRECRWDEIFEWILDHNLGAMTIGTSVTKHNRESYKNPGEYSERNVTHKYFYLPETSLVYNEELVFSYNTANYNKSIVILRDIYDVVQDILEVTVKNVDEIISNQFELFEEYAEELSGEAHRLMDGHKLFINYNKWSNDIAYRDEVAQDLGFQNKDTQLYEYSWNTTLRNKMRYKKYFNSDIYRLNYNTIYA